LWVLRQGAHGYETDQKNVSAEKESQKEANQNDCRTKEKEEESFGCSTQHPCSGYWRSR
jgi:hypothetical protein